MIPHASARPLAGPRGSLLVAMILAALLRLAMTSMCSSCRKAPPLPPAYLATVDLPAVAPPVHPEHASALLTLPLSNLQLPPTRSRNWTAQSSFMHNSHTCLRECVVPFGAARERLGAPTPGRSFFGLYVWPPLSEIAREANFRAGPGHR